MEGRNLRLDDGMDDFRHRKDLFRDCQRVHPLLEMCRSKWTCDPLGQVPLHEGLWLCASSRKFFFGIEAINAKELTFILMDSPEVRG